MTTLPSDPERLKYMREMLVEELKFRRQRRWDIFNTGSTLLLAFIGGVVAVTVSSGRLLPVSQKVLLTISALVVMIFMCNWWSRHNSCCKTLGKLLGPCEATLGVTVDWPKGEGRVNGRGMLCVLGVAAAVAAWLY